MSCTEFAKEDFEDTWRKVSKEFSHWEIFSEGKQMIASVKDMFLRDRDLYDMTYSLHTAIADTNAGAVNDILRKATFDDSIRRCSAPGIWTCRRDHPSGHS